MGDRLINEIDLSLKSLKEINYPHDQLEYYLLVPYYRPLSEFTKTFPKLKIIRFDETLEWSLSNAQREGLCFAKGNYIQMLNANYVLNPNWIKIGLRYLQHGKFLSIRSNDILKMNINSESDSFCLRDGLYDAKFLKHVIDDKTDEQIYADSFEKDVLTISESMVHSKKIKQYQARQPQFLNYRLRSILSKYVLAK